MFLLSPQGATLGCDKSASIPQVTNQHSQGKNNSEVQTTKGLEKPKGLVASRKNGLHKNYKSVNHHYLLGFAGLALGEIILKPFAHKLFSLHKGYFIDKEETCHHPRAWSDQFSVFHFHLLLASIQGNKLGNGHLVLPAYNFWRKRSACNEIERRGKGNQQKATPSQDTSYVMCSGRGKYFVCFFCF